MSAGFPSGVHLSLPWFSRKHSLENPPLSHPLEKVQKRHKTHFLFGSTRLFVRVSLLSMLTLCNRNFQDISLLVLDCFDGNTFSISLVPGFTTLSHNRQWKRGTTGYFLILWLAPHSAEGGYGRESKIELIFLHSGGKGTLIVRLYSIQETCSISVNSQIHTEKYRSFPIPETNGYIYIYIYIFYLRHLSGAFGNSFYTSSL